MLPLSVYLQNHGVSQYIYTTPIEIQQWLDTQPSNDKFEFIIYSIPLMEQSKLFKIRDVASWYGLLCEKIHNNQDTIISFLGLNDADRRKKTKEYLGLLIKELVSMNLFDSDLQSLLTNFLERSSEALNILLVLLAVDSVLTELTLILLSIELSPYKRWQSLGLPALPTVEEIETALISV